MPPEHDYHDYSDTLKALMAAVDISSYKALAQAAGVSESTIRRLRRGQIAHLKLATLLALSQALGIAIANLIAQFSPTPAPTPTPSSPLHDATKADEISALRREYQRLEQRLEAQQATLRGEFQQATLRILEPWLLQWPTAAHAAQQNPEIPASRLIPLTKPWDRLLTDWGVTAIGTVGEELSYDPQWHELMSGIAQPGDRVRVRYVGYHHSDRLLYRAKVSPVSP